MPRRAARTGLALLALGLATTLAYRPALGGPFVLDDFTVIGDPLVVAPAAQGPGDWLRAPRPLLAATFALDHALAGLDPRAFHRTSLLVHLGAVLLAFLVARRLLRRAGLAHPEGPALAAAGLFALHPLQTEAVASVAQRAEALAAALYLAALLVLLARDEAAAGRGRRLAGAAVLLALGLLVKPIGVTFPLAWLLAAAALPPAAEAADGAWARVRRRLPAAAPLLALALAATAWNLAATAGSDHAGLGMTGVTPWQYLATQATVLPTYLARLAWPAGQCADAFVPWREGLLDPAALGGTALLATLVAGALGLQRLARDRAGDDAAAARLAAFGFLFFLLVLAPTSSLVPLRDPLAEHRLYLAGLGLLAAAAAAATAGLRRVAPLRAGPVGFAVALALLAAAALATARRCDTWSSALAFHEAAAACAPQKARVQLNLGQALMKARRYPEAIAHLRLAAALQADRTVSPRQVFDALQAALLNAGRGAEARQAAEAALAAAPGDAWALANLAEVESEGGRPAAAEAAARAALRLEPGHGKALKYLGLARAELGDLPGAAAALRAAAAATLEPGVHHALALVEERLGDRAAACRSLDAALARSASLGVPTRAREDRARLGCR